MRCRFASLAVAGGAVLCLLAFAPSGALAADFCVQNSGCTAGGGTAEPSVEAALAAANSDGVLDRVLIGPGTFTAPTVFGYVTGYHPVQIIGSGAGTTTLTGPVGTDRVLFAGNTDSLVSDLTVAVPAGNTASMKVGIRLAPGSARRVLVSADPTVTPGVIGIEMNDGTLEDSTVDLGSKVPSVTTAVQADGGTTLVGDTLNAQNGINIEGPFVHAERDRVTAASGHGIAVVNSATGIDASDTTIQLVGNATGAIADTGNGTDAAISLLGVTILGDGSPGSSGVVASTATAHNATVSVNSSIIRGVGHSLLLGQNAGPASVDVSYSDYDPATIKKIFGTGTVMTGPGNISADPLFAGALDLHPQTGSPAIDSGDPAATSDSLDLDGNARVLDATGSGSARRDMGAFEAPAVAPPSPAGGSQPGGSQPAPAPAGSVAPAAFALSGLSISPSRFAVAGGGSKPRGARTPRGTRFGFQLSSAADVSITIQRRLAGHRARFHKVGSLRRHEAAGRGSIRFSGKLGRKALRPGRYRALVTAVDAAGHRSSPQRVTFTIVPR